MEERVLKKWNSRIPSDARSAKSKNSGASKPQSHVRRRTTERSQSASSRAPRFDFDEDDRMAARPSRVKDRDSAHRKSRGWHFYGGQRRSDLRDDIYGSDDVISLSPSISASRASKRSKSRLGNDDRRSRNKTPSARSRKKSLARSERSAGRDVDVNPYERDIRRDACRKTSGRKSGRSKNHDEISRTGSGVYSVYGSQSSDDECRRPTGSKFYHARKDMNTHRKSEVEVKLLKKVYMTRQRHEQAMQQLEKVTDTRDRDVRTSRYCHASPRVKHSGSPQLKRNGESPRRSPSAQYDYRTDSTVDPYTRSHRSHTHRSSGNYYDDDDREYEYDQYASRRDQYSSVQSDFKQAVKRDFAPARSPLRRSFRRDIEGPRRRTAGDDDTLQPLQPGDRKVLPNRIPPQSLCNRETELELNWDSDNPPVELEPLPQHPRTPKLVGVSLDAAPKGRTSVSYSRPLTPPKHPKAPKADELWVTESLTVPNYTTKHAYVPPCADRATPSHSSQALANDMDSDEDLARMTEAGSDGRLTMQSCEGNGGVNTGFGNASYTQQILAQRDDRRLLPVQEEGAHAPSLWQVTCHNEVDGVSDGRPTVYVSPNASLGDEHRIIQQQKQRLTEMQAQLLEKQHQLQYEQQQNARVTTLPEKEYEDQQAQMPQPISVLDQPRQMTQEERDRLRAEKREKLMQQKSIMSKEEQRSLLATLRKRRDDVGPPHCARTVTEFNQCEQQRYDRLHERDADGYRGEEEHNQQKQMDVLAHSLEAMRKKRMEERQQVTQHEDGRLTYNEEKRKQIRDQQEERRHAERLRSQQLEEKLQCTAVTPMTFDF